MIDIRKLLLLLITILSFSCSSGDDGAGTEDSKPNPTTNPNPNKTTTYDADVKTIIDTNCIQCHSNPPTQGAPMSLTNYQEVITAINGKRDVVGRMETTGRNVMPPNNRLPQETIDVMLDWVADGFKEK
ncbi:hypothetical protein [Aquimarina longa]|uniref:hypothetical protein n=1 Tax=Aquimarina longa TaxID=1080221 RepID=UPI0007830DB8|nr:hypothetical protein [Aquimarina longa]